MDFTYAVKHYMEYVLGLRNVDLRDGPRMCVELDPDEKALKKVKGRYQMILPMSLTSRTAMWGQPIADSLSDEVTWGLLIGGLYHEAGHLISGEPVFTSPLRGKVANVINDSNENNVIPDEWFGSVRYINTLNLFLGKIIEDCALRPVGNLEEQFRFLLSAANDYRIDLSLTYEGKRVQDLPDSHPLAEAFKKIKPIMEKARRVRSLRSIELQKERTKLINRLQRILSAWYKEQPEEEKQKSGASTLGGLTQGGPQKTTDGEGPAVKSSVKDNEEAARDIARAMQASVSDEMKNDADASALAGRYEEICDNEERTKRDVKNIEDEDKRWNVDQYLSDDLSTDDDDESGPSHGEQSVPPAWAGAAYAKPDEDSVRDLRAIFRRLMFGRAYTGRRVDITGRKLHAPNFYQVKLTDKPAIMRDVGRVKTDVSRTDVVFCFDASGSMRMSGDDQFCRKVMATFYAAVKPIRGLRLVMYGFNGRPFLIPDGPNVFHEIEAKLAGTGGTRFDLAQRVGMRALERSQGADRKILVMLTDGDLGHYTTGWDYGELKRQADRQGIQLIVLDVHEGSALERERCFHSVIFMKNIKELLGHLRKIVQKRF